MNITGGFNANILGGYEGANFAFQYSTSDGSIHQFNLPTGSNYAAMFTKYIGFEASRSWTGENYCKYIIM